MFMFPLKNLARKRLIITETEAGYQSDAGSTKDTPYLTLIGKLWGFFCQYLWENWPRYNSTALYMYYMKLWQWEM